MGGAAGLLALMYGPEMATLAADERECRLACLKGDLSRECPAVAEPTPVSGKGLFETQAAYDARVADAEAKHAAALSALAECCAKQCEDAGVRVRLALRSGARVAGGDVTQTGVDVAGDAVGSVFAGTPVDGLSVTDIVTGAAAIVAIGLLVVLLVVFVRWMFRPPAASGNQAMVVRASGGE